MRLQKGYDWPDLKFYCVVLPCATELFTLQNTHIHLSSSPPRPWRAKAHFRSVERMCSVGDLIFCKRPSCSGHIRHPQHSEGTLLNIKACSVINFNVSKRFQLHLKILMCWRSSKANTPFIELRLIYYSGVLGYWGAECMRIGARIIEKKLTLAELAGWWSVSVGIRPAWTNSCMRCDLRSWWWLAWVAASPGLWSQTAVGMAKKTIKRYHLAKWSQNQRTER